MRAVELTEVKTILFAWSMIVSAIVAASFLSSGLNPKNSSHMVAKLFRCSCSATNRTYSNRTLSSFCTQSDVYITFLLAPTM